MVLWIETWAVMGFKWSVDIAVNIFITENYPLSTVIDFNKILDSKGFNF